MTASDGLPARLQDGARGIVSKRLGSRYPVYPKPDMTCSLQIGGPASALRLPHHIEAELISALGMGTNLDVAAADQSRPSATRAAKLINPMRRIFIPHLGK